MTPKELGYEMADLAWSSQKGWDSQLEAMCVGRVTVVMKANRLNMPMVNSLVEFERRIEFHRRKKQKSGWTPVRRKNEALA